MKGASAQSHLHHAYIHKHTIGDNRPPNLGLRNHLYLYPLHIEVENFLKHRLLCVKRWFTASSTNHKKGRIQFSILKQPLSGEWSVMGAHKTQTFNLESNGLNFLSSLTRYFCSGRRNDSNKPPGCQFLKKKKKKTPHTLQQKYLKWSQLKLRLTKEESSSSSPPEHNLNEQEGGFVSSLECCLHEPFPCPPATNLWTQILQRNAFSLRGSQITGF